MAHDYTTITHEGWYIIKQRNQTKMCKKMLDPWGIPLLGRLGCRAINIALPRQVLLGREGSPPGTKRVRHSLPPPTWYTPVRMAYSVRWVLREMKIASSGIGTRITIFISSDSDHNTTSAFKFKFPFARHLVRIELISVALVNENNSVTIALC